MNVFMLYNETHKHITYGMNNICHSKVESQLLLCKEKCRHSIAKENICCSPKNKTENN